MKESLTIRSTISSQVLKKVLFKGFALAFLGMMLLVVAGILIPPAILQQWGWILFLISLGLLTWGLLPYRHLARLQLKPNELILDSFHHLTFYSKEKQIWTIPLQSIAQTDYIDHPQRYGIIIRLKSSHQGQKDLFLPYFNRHAYEELREWLDEELYKPL